MASASLGLHLEFGRAPLAKWTKGNLTQTRSLPSWQPRTAVSGSLHRPAVGEFKCAIFVWIEKYRVRNIYVFGSRLYRCNSKDSDWDVMAVVDGDYFYSSFLLSGREGALELSIYHAEYWQEIISGNMITGLLVCYAPQEYRIKEDFLVPVEIKVPMLQRTIRMDSSHNFNKARRLFKEGDVYTAKKNFVRPRRVQVPRTFAERLSSLLCPYSLRFTEFDIYCLLCN